MTTKSKRERNRITAIILALSIPFSILILLNRLKTEAVNAIGRSTFTDRMAGIPRVILWAWERPEDLRFIDSREVGVAFFARALYLRNGTVAMRPRLQPLKVPSDSVMMAVVRIESDNAVKAITELTRISGVKAIQVDFDAKATERGFYRDLLNDLRRQLPESMALSITALASWCLGDNWLPELPVDEAVPMRRWSSCNRCGS